MQSLLLLIAFIGYSSISYCETVSSSVNSLNGEFSYTEGNSLSTQIKTEYGQIDNFYRNNDDKQETTFLELSSEVFVQTQGENSLFQLKANVNLFTFDKFSSDDHHDFSVLTKYHLKFAQSQKVFVTAYMTDNYEYRGTGVSLGEADSLKEGDTKRDAFLNVGYLYGHQDSLAKVKLLVGYRDFSYLTRENITKPLAYSSSYIQGNIDYLISGNTYFSTKVQFENFSYDMNADLERKQYLALAGVTWRSTELTQMQLLLGYQKAVFDNQDFGDKDNFAWQVTMMWNPIERIRFNFSSGSEIKDSNNIVKSVSFSNYYGLGLHYDFNEKFKFFLRGRIVNEDVVSIESTIKEERFESTTRVQYEWRHWLSVFAQYNYNTFDSTRIIYDYDLQTLSVGAAVTF